MARRLASDRLLVVFCDPVPSILQSVKEGQDGTRNEKLAHVLRQMYLQRLFMVCSSSKLNIPLLPPYCHLKLPCDQYQSH